MLSHYDIDKRIKDIEYILYHVENNRLKLTELFNELSDSLNYDLLKDMVKQLNASLFSIELEYLSMVNMVREKSNDHIFINDNDIREEKMQ